MVFAFPGRLGGFDLFGGWRPEVPDRHIQYLVIKMAGTGLPAAISDAVIRYVGKNLRNSCQFAAGDDRVSQVFPPHEGILADQLFVLAVEHRRSRHRYQVVAAPGQPVHVFTAGIGHSNGRYLSDSERLWKKGRKLFAVRHIRHDHHRDVAIPSAGIFILVQRAEMARHQVAFIRKKPEHIVLRLVYRLK